MDAIVCCVGADVDSARRLLPVVAHWSHHLGCDPGLLHVTGPGAQPPADASADRATLENLTHLARELSARGVTATWQTVPDADPATSILRFASQLPGPVVVMASHGRTCLRRLALGSVTLEVLRASPHPVLVVPAAASADEAAR